MARAEALAILESGEFDQLIGRPETPEVEFKGEPYQLDRETQRFELAKDVSAMANAAGGVIIFRAQTFGWFWRQAVRLFRGRGRPDPPLSHQGSARPSVAPRQAERSSVHESGELQRGPSRPADVAGYDGWATAARIAA